MGTTIYALTDSHQESRNLSRLLSGIYRAEENNGKPFLVLDGGDLFKGIYDKDLSVNAYLKLKELLPAAQIFIALGNNDFGFTKSDFEYLKQTVKKFKSAGINVICANLTDEKTGCRADWIDEYKIIEINGQRILITGFCLNNSCAKKFHCELTPPEPAFKNLIGRIDEKYDKTIILNHHWYSYSKSLKDFAKSNGINIDLIIGGHEHSPIKPDFENNIFYPLSFARTMYKMELNDILENIIEIPLETIRFLPEFENPVIEYEQETELKKPLAKRVLDLSKCYSDPCPLGTFISDSMKRTGQTDIAFHSTGFTMHPLRYKDSTIITKYDLEQVMCPTTAVIEKIEITAEQLKKVFNNAAKFRMYRDRGNARFLQCSGNIRLTGVCNKKSMTCKIIQIEINGEKLLDEHKNPLNPQKIYTCTIDDFIGAGEQGFDVLKDIPKTKILKDGKEITLSEVFYSAACNAEKIYTSPEYPSFEFIDI